MPLAHGTDRLESTRLVLRRVGPDDLPFSTRLHALPEVARQLAVLRKDDGVLIGRCGLMDLVVESAVPGRGIRRGWFGGET